MKITLNLIPSHEKDKIQQEKRLRLLLQWEIALSLLLGIFILVLVSTNYILSIHAFAVSDGGKSGEAYKKIGAFQKEVEKMNNQVLQVDEIMKEQLYWTRLGEIVNRNISDGVMLTSLATKEYEVFLVGKSETREELVRLKEVLEKEECVSRLNFPFSNLISRENVSFQIDFEIKKQCLLSNEASVEKI